GFYPIFRSENHSHPAPASRNRRCPRRSHLRDIQDLGWGECPVGSVLSIHAGSAASSP
ncbi:hypothetical protein ZWY2020_005936, partial [Hordeum vulgare]